MFSVLKNYSLQNIRRFLKTNRTAKLLTVFGFFVSFAFLVLVVYAGSRYGFQYIKRDEFFGDALFLYMSELFLLVTFILVSASALVSGMFSLFEGRDSVLLMTSPRFTLRPRLVILRMFVASLWPILAIILPALFAIHHVYGLPLLGFLFSLVAITLLVLLGVALAMVTMLIIAWVLYFLGRKSGTYLNQRNFVFFSVLMFLLQLVFVWRRVTTIDLVQFFQARILDITTVDLWPIIEQFQALPTHFATMVIYYSRNGEYAGVLPALSILATLLAALLLALFFLMRNHLTLWKLFQEHVGRNRGGAWSYVLFSATSLLRVENSDGAIIGKEILSFFRNTRGVLWLGFILLIWLFQTGASKILSRGLGVERVSGGDISAFVGALQFAVIMYFVSMFVLRFAFPSFSSERKTAWVVGSAPIDLRVVFRSKLRFFVVLFSLLAIVFALLNSFIAGLALSQVFTLLFTILTATLFLTALGLSLGAIFPNFESDDPEVLSTTLPGLGFIFGALFYGGLGAYLLHLIVKGGDEFPLLLFVFCSLFLTIVFVRKAERTLARAPYA